VFEGVLSWRRIKSTSINKIKLFLNFEHLKPFLFHQANIVNKNNIIFSIFYLLSSSLSMSHLKLKRIVLGGDSRPVYAKIHIRLKNTQSHSFIIIKNNNSPFLHVTINNDTHLSESCEAKINKYNTEWNGADRTINNQIYLPTTYKEIK
jgi:hypothetical protein